MYSKVDFVERSKKAMAGYMSANPEQLPDGSYRCYFGNRLLPSPVLSHSQWDCGDCTARSLECWLYLREITGDKETGKEVEEGQRKFLLSILHPKTGLVFVPERSDSNNNRYYYNMWDQGRTMRFLVRWYLSLEEQPEERRKVKSLTDRMIQGLRFLAEYGTDPIFGDYALFKSDSFLNREPLDESSWVTRAGQVLEPMAMYAEATDDPEVLDFAIKLAHGALTGREWPRKDKEGNIIPQFGEDGSFVGHFHTLSSLVLGMVKLGAYLMKKGGRDIGLELIRWSRKVYDWIFDVSANVNASSKIGWFPENMGDGTQVRQISETCCTADMIELAASQASTAGLDPSLAHYADLWEDVECFTRNGLLKAQFQITPDFLKLLEGMPTAPKIQNSYLTFSVDAGEVSIMRLKVSPP